MSCSGEREDGKDLAAGLAFPLSPGPGIDAKSDMFIIVEFDETVELDGIVELVGMVELLETSTDIVPFVMMALELMVELAMVELDLS